MKKEKLHALYFGLILLAFCQTPLFLLANEISRDEWQKVGLTVVIATITITGFLVKEIWAFIAQKKVPPKE